VLNTFIWYLIKVKNYLIRFPKVDSELPYRKYLFDELIDIYSEDYFKNKRFLEIGPRDGEDTFRLEALSPKEMVIFDLPDKTENNLTWIKKLKTNYKFIENNFMYIVKDEFDSLGKFDLIYFTGVLYHNPEQLRFLQKIYQKLNDNGVLVLESATTRQRSLINKNVVEILYPSTYRGTTTITHLPSKKAILSWLKMVGFNKIFESNCYKPENYNSKNHRFACIAEKTKDDVQEVYYKKQIEESPYIIGAST
tara:strand:+ start:2872 stop:3624 length:753 start_codon:yes stop_codon:yes gene_type:complete